MYYILHLTTRYYIFVKRRTVLCNLCTLCIPNLSTPSKCTSCTGTLFGSGCSFIFRAPKISDRSTEPFAETKRFKRSTSAPLSATLLCHASVPCFCAMFQGHFRATSGPLQGHIVKGFDKGTSYGAACSMPSDWVTRNPLLQKEAATSRKISFFLCLMPSDRQDLNHSRHKHQLSMT
jgi:hypothetical protein